MGIKRVLKNGKYVLFGAAKMGFEFYESQHIDVVYFFDNDEKKWGTRFGGIECIKPQYIEKVEIIIANDKHDIDMVVQLIDLGYRIFYVIRKIGDDEINGIHYGIDKFDYTSYVDFKIIDNKMALLSNSNSGCNAFCFKYMIDNFADSEFEILLLNANKKEEDYYYDIITSRYIFLTMSFTNLKDRIIIQAYHGFPIKGIGYFDTNICEDSFELTHRDALNFKYVLSYSKLYTTCYGASFGIPKSRFIMTGMPRNDVLLQSNGYIKLCELYPQIKNKKIILYMPTYRERVKFDDDEMQGYLFCYPDFDKDTLEAFLESNNLILLIKMHPSDTGRFETITDECNSIIYIKEEDYYGHDFYEYINGIDILITDYSSVFVDFLLLDKPIIFAHRDYEKYNDERGTMWEPVGFWYPGARVTCVFSLMEEINITLCGQDNYKEQRHLLSDIMHKYQDGNSSKRLLHMLGMERR